MEDNLKGLNKEELKNVIEDIKEEYSKIIVPIDDERSTAVYRKGVCMNFDGEFLKGICSDGGFN